MIDTADLNIFGKSYILEWDKNKNVISITETTENNPSKITDEQKQQGLSQSDIDNDFYDSDDYDTDEHLETYDFKLIGDDEQ